MPHPKTVRFGVISDLHYMRHKDNEPCRPHVSSQGPHADPMSKLLSYLNEQRAWLAGPDGSIVDYLICPGDIGNRADPAAFDEGWQKLKELKELLGARHVIASTGNHEVHSRVDKGHDAAGLAELSIDPLDTLQKHQDYPSSLLSPSIDRWIYWGRGYAIASEPDVHFLLINSSHYHTTTRANEYERGRIGGVALECMEKDLQKLVDRSAEKLHVAVLHHHPIAHQDGDLSLGKIEMDNGALLVQVLERTGVTWLIIHGHKHHPRLLLAQGARARPVVFAAGSFGAQLEGALTTKSRNQFYILEAELVAQQSWPKAAGHIRAWSWSGLEWTASTEVNHGIPNGCGYRVPDIDFAVLTADISRLLAKKSSPFLTFEEVVEKVPNLRHLLPGEWATLRQALQTTDVKTTWDLRRWFPTDFSI